MGHLVSAESFRFEELWQRFEGWLLRNTPEDHIALRPGASDSDILKLESGIGFEINRDLKKLLSMHNGVAARRTSTEAGAFVLGYSLLDAEGILEWQQNLAEMAEEAEEDGYEDEVIGRTAHRQWVPLAQSLTGDLIFIDHRSDHYGDIGELSFGSPEYTWLWPGMGLMMHDLCNAVESMMPLPALGRRPSVHQGRLLEWGTA
ncbi:SMI1/KNR4 family protein [Streptomyces sp. NPDC057910]|uniref:SMI1/KNR4 family protein n=1 Tax=Streptomyces sp. NPDC057910 TaxID=3346278 RepID=UPI0036EB9733